MENVKFVITRELFIESIGEIEKQFIHDNKCSDAFSVILPFDFVSAYDNHWVTNQLVEILKLAMNDNNKDSWIEYFIWELEFSKKYKVGCASMEDGSNIDLSNAGKLWDFLTDEKYKNDLTKI